MNEELATEEWFKSRVDNPASLETMGSPELAAGTAAQWPAISPGHAPSSDIFRASHWESAVDKVSGRTYYFDRVTNRSQWEVPEGATASFPNVLPASPTKFEDKRRHANFKMYKGEEVDLTCLRHTGIHCEMTQFGMDLLHSCPQITGGPSDCIGGVGGGECQCDPGYCSTSKGHCHTDRSTYVEGTFKISTKGTKKEYLHMVTDTGGQGHVTLKDGSDDAAKWRIIKRPDGSHILTTVKYPYAALDFYQQCTGGDDCTMHIGLTVNPEGSEIGTQLKYIQGGHMVIADTHSNQVLYFPHLKDKTAEKKALGCAPSGYNCPTDTGYLVFDPELPSNFLENLEDVDVLFYKQVGLFILAGFCLCLMLFICWWQLFTEVKGTRFL